MKSTLGCFAVIFFLLCTPTLSQTKKAAPDTNAISVPGLEVRLSGTDLYRSLVSDVSQEVDKLARERDTERWKLIGIVATIFLAVIGFLGFHSLSDLRRKVAMDVAEDLRNHDTIKSLVEEAVRAHVTSDIEKRLRTVAKELAFYRLSNLATSILAGKGFTNSERDAAVASLEELKDETGIISRKEFADVLEKIIDSFASADLDFEIDSIDESLELVIMDSMGIIQTLMNHYGMRVLGDIEVSPSTVERFQKYAEACKRKRYYELALPYLMVLEHSEKRDGWESRIQALLQDATHLESKEQQIVVEMIATRSDHDAVAKKLTGQIVRFCSKFKAFADEFGDVMKSKLNKERDGNEE